MPSKEIELFQKNPVAFIEQAFGDSLWEKQKEIANSVRDFRYTTVKSCHGSGKSFTCARIAQQFLHSYPNSKVITTAPTFRQVEDILWRELRSSRSKSRVNLGGHLTQTRLDLSENWFAVGLSTDDPDRFQGYHAPYIFILVDEASGVMEPIFEAIEGIISAGFARVLYVGNPTALAGTFYQSFRLENHKKITITAFDTPNFTTFGITLDDIRNNTWKEKITTELPRPYLITPEWVHDKYLKWGESSPMWQARVMAEFPSQGDDTLIPLSKIEEATRREIIPAAEDAEQIGADIARFGVDKTIFLYRKGAAVQEIKELSQIDTMEVASRLHDFARFHPFAQLHVDVIGVGAGVVDRLRQLEEKREVVAVNVGLPAHDTEMFYNLRAEMYWGLRDRFMEGSISIPDDDELISQLSNIKFKYTPKGQIQMESKEDMKKRGLPSPDKADALVLAFGKAEDKPSILEFMKGFQP